MKNKTFGTLLVSGALLGAYHMSTLDKKVYQNIQDVGDTTSSVLAQEEKEEERLWNEFFDLVQKNHDRDRFGEMDFIEWISQWNGNSIHVVLDDNKNVVGGYILSDHAHFITLLRPENWFGSRRNTIKELKNVGTRHLSYETTVNNSQESLESLMRNVPQKVYMITKEGALEEALIASDVWKKIQLEDGSYFNGQERPERTYITNK